MNTKPLIVLDKALKLGDDAEETGKRTKRMTELLKSPEDERTGNWFMCVPSCFNNALDIRQTPRKKDGKEELVWTQGSAFSFKGGDKIYDTPKAYAEWGEALTHLSLCISVEESTDATPEKGTAGMSGFVPRNPGSVLFSFLTHNDQKSAVEKHGEARLTQDEFVRFLIRGPEGELKQRIPWKR